jgi:hypothetical protein
VCFQNDENVVLYIKSEAGKVVTKEEVIKGYSEAGGQAGDERKKGKAFQKR